MRTLQDLINEFEPIILEATYAKGKQYIITTDDIDGIIRSLDKVIAQILRDANKEINELMARLEKGILARRPTWGEIWGDFKQGWNNWLSGNYPGGKNYDPEMPRENLELHSLMRKFETLYEAGRDMSQRGVLDRPQRIPDSGMNIFGRPRSSFFNAQPSGRGRSPNLDAYERDTRGNSNVQPLLKWFRKSLEVIFRKHIESGIKQYVKSVMQNLQDTPAAASAPTSAPGPDLDAANAELRTLGRRQQPEPDMPSPQPPKPPETPPPPKPETKKVEPEPETPPPPLDAPPKEKKKKKKKTKLAPKDMLAAKVKELRDAGFPAPGDSDEELAAKEKLRAANAEKQTRSRPRYGEDGPQPPVVEPKLKTDAEDDFSDLFGDDDDVDPITGAADTLNDFLDAGEPEDKGATEKDEHPIKTFIKSKAKEAGISDEEIDAVTNWDDPEQTQPLLSKLPDD